MSDDTLIDIHDEDRGIVWCLCVEFQYRPPVAPVMGWRDGGDPGDCDDVEILGVQYMGGEFRFSESPEVRIALAMILPNNKQELLLVDALKRQFAEKIRAACLERGRKSWEHAA